MTKKQITKILDHIIEATEDCSCEHCALYKWGTYLDGLLTALR